jgi:uncharacterized coiled-coil DUF342 family protein
VTPPPHPKSGPAEPEDEEISGVRTQLVGAEKQLKRMLDRRDERNAVAAELRAQRDAINAQKRTLVDEVRVLSDEREKWNAIAREHREKRNAFQKEAKELIELRKRERQGTAGFAAKVRSLEGELKALEFQQQTTTLTIAKENALLKQMAEMRKELAAARVQAENEGRILANVQDLGARIDELFKSADAEHALVVEASNAAQAIHGKIEPLAKELLFLDQQSDEKHQAFLAARAEADALHERVVDSREKVVGLRGERARIEEERRLLVDNQNKSVQEALFDEEKIDEAADEAVRLLLGKGKVQLNRG